MESVVLASALFAILAYLIGSVPFGLLVTHAFLDQDIRSVGSGNIGATNVLRTGSKVLAATTLILDAGKAALPILIIYQWQSSDMPTEPWWPALAAVSVCLGHCYPIWLNFRGGKAVSCFFGVWFTMSIFFGATIAIAWIVIAVIWKRSSLAALSASFAAPIMVFESTMTFVFMTVLSVLIWVRHRDNIRRLLDGSEPLIGQ